MGCFVKVCKNCHFKVLYTNIIKINKMVLLQVKFFEILIIEHFTCNLPQWLVKAMCFSMLYYFFDLSSNILINNLWSFAFNCSFNIVWCRYHVSLCFLVCLNKGFHSILISMLNVFIRFLSIIAHKQPHYWDSFTKFSAQQCI